MNSRHESPDAMQSMAVDGVPPPAQLVCRQCQRYKAPDEFRRRYADRECRIHQCRTCHAEAERLRRQAKRSRAHRRCVNRDLARIKLAKSSRQLTFVCESMIRSFGGADGFAKAWTACLRGDLQRGGFAALRHLEAVIRLVQHCEAQRPDYSEFSDGELQQLADAFGLG